MADDDAPAQRSSLTYSVAVAGLTTVTAAVATPAAIAAAGQDDFGLEGIISHRVQIRGEALTGARWTDMTGKTNEH
ncbi:MAG: hypothetical protein JRF56_14945 [Deltaproteobacteria bacterium]|nr:hypothetical protein [Deltaproteobacteria bacterium]